MRIRKSDPDPQTEINADLDPNPDPHPWCEDVLSPPFLFSISQSEMKIKSEVRLSVVLVSQDGFHVCILRI